MKTQNELSKFSKEELLELREGLHEQYSIVRFDAILNNGQNAREYLDEQLSKVLAELVNKSKQKPRK